MPIEKVRQFFREAGIENRIQEFDSSSATVALAAEAVGCEEKRIAKTLSFSTADGCVLVVAAGDARVDNVKFKAQFHEKASMLPSDRVEATVGHAVGGVCPFCVNEGVRIYLDQSLLRFPTVYPSCGSKNSAIELTCAELERFTRSSSWVDVCKGWEP